MGASRGRGVAARRCGPPRRDPSGQWAAETECMVFGISLAEGLEIARRFEQNAVVFIERGNVPRLEFPEE